MKDAEKKIQKRRGKIKKGDEDEYEEEEILGWSIIARLRFLNLAVNTEQRYHNLRLWKLRG